MTSSFGKLLVLAIISIVMLVLAGLAYDWLKNKLGIKPPPPPQPQPAVPTPTLAIGVYSDVGCCVTDCANNSKTSGLAVTQNPAQNHVPLNQRVRGTMQRPFLIYEFQRNIVGTVIKDGKTVRTYDSTPLNQMVEILNRSIEGHCINHGCFPVVIVDAKDIGDGRVRLAVAESPVNIWGANNV